MVKQTSHLKRIHFPLLTLKKHDPIYFRNPIERNRYFFLQDLKEKYHLPPIKVSLWRGTALHLLELAHYISPEMHQAADTYFSITQQALKGGPALSVSKTKQPEEHSFIPFRDRFYDPAHEEKTEKQWRALSSLLEKKGIKCLVDELGGEHDLKVLDHLLKTKPALLKVQEGLKDLQIYVETSF
jgi:hypothetical protein